ncbi:nitroreductase family protein [Desulfotalea psychrophila]|uniref:Related to ferredoxin n=1 Tax=Desulfotalea psychrophila (strain LSv54 / DSM 12343) TaxID=177439 RepID=Q6ANI9_DESPS|nr:nitroreductase family protein [Desulfotalea psychrophila]CAG36085.1 related to ferredoxin [Desulfotalea psychrophila LSv54]
MINFCLDQERCNKCGACAMDCPASIIEIQADFPRVFPYNEESCYQCEHCLAICPTAAISILDINPQTDCLPLKGMLPSPEQMEALVRGRRSSRHYQKKNVEKETVDWLLEMTAHAPTGVNSRSQMFTLVDDMEVMDKIRQEAMAGLKATIASGNLPEKFQYFAQIAEAWENGIDTIFRGAPHMLIISSPEDAPCPEADPFIALSYFELCAATKNIGTLWCGLAKYTLFDILPELGRKIGVPENHKSVYIMLFGKTKLKYARTVQRKNRAINRVRL